MVSEPDDVEGEESGDQPVGDEFESHGYENPFGNIETSDISDEDLLLEAYKQASQESRYRDGLMHNSYYLVIIAAIIASGNIYSLSDGEYSTLMSLDVLTSMLLVSGIAMSGIGIVMLTYNRKRINAEDLRQCIEHRIDDDYSGQQPLMIQSAVIGGGLNPEGFAQENEQLDQIENAFRKKLPIATISIFFIYLGAFVAAIGVLAGILTIYSIDGGRGVPTFPERFLFEATLGGVVVSVLLFFKAHRTTKSPDND